MTGVETLLFGLAAYKGIPTLKLGVRMDLLGAILRSVLFLSSLAQGK